MFFSLAFKACYCIVVKPHLAHPLGVGELMGYILGPNSMSRRIHWLNTDTTLYLAQLERPDKCLTIKGLNVLNSWNKGLLDLLKGLVTINRPLRYQFIKLN